MINMRLEIPDEFEKIAPNLGKSLSKDLERLHALKVESHPDLSAHLASEKLARAVENGAVLPALEPTREPEPEVVRETPAEFKVPEQLPMHSFTDIRERDDGSFVVTLTTSVGVLDYHVTKPEIDPSNVPGLHDAVLAAIKNGATVSPWENPAAPEPSEDEKLAVAKAEAKHIIELMQYEFDVAGTGEKKILSGPLQEWKRYRLDLEKTGLAASKPEKPQWIN